MIMTRKKKVLVGMSGGVDSSVSAALLLEQGYEVIGAFMKNWSENECEGPEFKECGWKIERRDAARVAAKLGIPFLTFDFEKEYRRDVIEYLFRESSAGRTPNPDVMCNKFIKFDRFVREADRLGCGYVATGHYARIATFPSLRSKRRNLGKEIASVAALPRNDKKCVLAGKDSNKDQTYFLWAIDKKILPRIIFPVGEMTKPEVRAKARKLGLDVAEKKDSVGICFVGEVEMREFLKTRIKEDPGKIVTSDGKIVGEHSGINFFTIGQRHGLNIGGGNPYYVVEKREKTKELVVTSNYHPSLYKDELEIEQINLLVESLPKKIKCEARIRYRQPLQSCAVTFLPQKKAVVKFDKPQRAVTSGQSIVFYDGEVMLGGGIIE
ncbi:tRNA 2-thiouridine(34) synthase MnmA [Candidatus Uhrbacteria bacterium]|nr:tRNA 2-thiouridine(34) synthase MnmA [Candidatus Uhrbacteria bacterium]